jgi:hypothetical protein
MDNTEVMYQGVYWVEVAPNTKQRRDFVNAVMGLRALNSNNCSERMNTELRSYITVWTATFVDMCEYVMFRYIFKKEKL